MKNLLIIYFINLSWFSLLAQPNDTTFKSSGKPIVQVFGYSKIDASENAKQPVSFGITRAHMGYQYNFSKTCMAAVIADLAGRTTTTEIIVTDTSGQQLPVSNSGKEGSYYTAFLKFAYIQWKPSDKLTLQIGGVLQNHYITQEKFWGYRYVYETFQDRYYGTSSGDFGAIGYYKINKLFGFDLAVTNGEGIRFKQDDYGKVKIASGIDIEPVKGFISRLYYDNTSTGDTSNNATQHLFSFFAGYQTDKVFRVGVDVNYRVNNQHYKNRDFWGYSFFGTYIVNPKIEIFARFDNVLSNTLPGEAESWNIAKEGHAYIAGVHYQPVKTINFSINYQAWDAKSENVTPTNYIFLNTEFKF